MKKDNLTRLLIPIGLLLVSGASFLNRYMQLPDFITGLLQGAGLGLMILFLIKKGKLKRGDLRRDAI